MTPDEIRLSEIAARLDRHHQVPHDVLGDIVMHDGLCVSAFTEGEPPQLLGIDAPDRELAWLLCVACPVQDECLELELRTSGEQTLGVWGALPAQDLRALHPLWRARRRDGEPLSDQEPNGGQR